MRQWLVEPKILCRQHLLGEHNEHHLLLGTFKRKRKVDGFIRNNLLEPRSLLNRHNELVAEMIRRGYNHKSPLDFNVEVLQYLGESINKTIDKHSSLNELIRRCDRCRENYNKIKEE